MATKHLTNKTFIWKDLSVLITASFFITDEKTSEIHAMIEIQEKGIPAPEQFQMIERTVIRMQQDVIEFKGCIPVFKRYFISDAVNQSAFIRNENNVAISIIQQPPLNGTKVCLWIYWIENSEVTAIDNKSISIKRGRYKHLYTTGITGNSENEEIETDSIFTHYINSLKQNNCTLKDNCIRTWIFVQGIDLHYQGMVTSRKKCFDKEGLTIDNHYIASTGIEGKHINPCTIVAMDAYALKGIKTNQVYYLKAATHLNSTAEYGVTFERGTVVEYGDRKHIYISGTASINNKGDVVAPFDIVKQINRIFENIEALLTEGCCSIEDVAQMIVYLRDIADYDVVSGYLSDKYHKIPKAIVWAPVCRPGWLIEIECIAIQYTINKEFDPF
jgi:enamine deaminase RidA (YjgF/YER057c/UK114 family)